MSTRSRLLEILEGRKGSYVSGEELAGLLKISRAAVWKGIQALRKEGHAIRAVTNRGYALEEASDVLSEEALRLWTGEKEAKIEVWPTLPSTNERLKRLALEERLPQGSLVAAMSQSQGKGRRGRSFHSPKESGLYFSVLLYPKKNISRSIEITAAAGAAVCRAVEENCGISLGIKWVNDLYLGEKKVCGILTEAVADVETGDIELAVVGIGLNLYEPAEGYPKEIQKKAGSLFGKGKGVDRNRLAGAIVRELLEESKKEGISEEYISRNIVPGREVWIEEEGQKRTAKAMRILPDGKLLILNERGEEEVLPWGDVSLLPLSGEG